MIQLTVVHFEFLCFSLNGELCLILPYIIPAIWDKEMFYKDFESTPVASTFFTSPITKFLQ